MQKICYKANIKTCKVYYIKKKDLFYFFAKKNLGILYGWVKIDNWL